MWNTLSFEDKMLQKLKEEFGDEMGNNIYTEYSAARNSLIEDNFFSQIQGVEPNLTDHSERHIANVMQNAYDLLGEAIDELTALDLYCLGLIILFHDVGNIDGRFMHNKNIATVYDFVRKRDTKYNREKAIVIKAGEAHCGLSKDKSKDTLKDVEKIDSLLGKPVRLRDLAAILRFADELAEGNQRTSQFMLEKHKYDSESTIFHQYATITHIFIDRPGERISITYDIDFDSSTMKEEQLGDLLEFTYKRLLKLDEERRYNKHYCDLLYPFKRTSIQFNLAINGIPSNLDLQRIELDDRFPIPGEADSEKIISKLKSDHPNIEFDHILAHIQKESKDEK